MADNITHKILGQGSSPDNPQIIKVDCNAKSVSIPCKLETEMQVDCASGTWTTQKYITYEIVNISLDPVECYRKNEDNKPVERTGTTSVLGETFYYIVIQERCECECDPTIIDESYEAECSVIGDVRITPETIGPEGGEILICYTKSVTTVDQCNNRHTTTEDVCQSHYISGGTTSGTVKGTVYSDEDDPCNLKVKWDVVKTPEIVTSCTPSIECISSSLTLSTYTLPFEGGKVTATWTFIIKEQKSNCSVISRAETIDVEVDIPGRKTTNPSEDCQPLQETYSYRFFSNGVISPCSGKQIEPEDSQFVEITFEGSQDAECFKTCETTISYVSGQQITANDVIVEYFNANSGIWEEFNCETGFVPYTGGNIRITFTGKTQYINSDCTSGFGEEVVSIEITIPELNCSVYDNPIKQCEPLKEFVKLTGDVDFKGRISVEYEIYQEWQCPCPLNSSYMNVIDDQDLINSYNNKNTSVKAERLDELTCSGGTLIFSYDTDAFSKEFS